MQWRFWQKQQDGKIPMPVRRAVQRQFGVDARVLDKLSCAVQPGSFTSQPVKYIRVFDPTHVTTEGKAMVTYEDLASRRDALVFEGHMDADGYVFLADKHPQVAPLAKSS
ncbi:MAG: hypothetical protein Q8O40_08425 [Chloroflexota bacterium]|nr:hypothetical protein [Chloroflexota bacterium]